MFSLCIDTAKAPSPPRAGANEIDLAAGWIRKLPIRHLRMDDLFENNKLEVWIGDAADPFASGAADLADYAKVEIVEGVKIIIDWCRNPAKIEIVRTADGSTPLHVSFEDGVLLATWDFEEIAFALKRPKPNLELCRLYLEKGPSLTRDQVIEGIYNVWPGERVRCDGHTICIIEQQWREIAVPSFLAGQAVVTDEFLRLIGESVAHNVERSNGVLLEISGGWDSTCTALGVAGLQEGMSSYGVVHEGAIGKQQRARRRELTSLLSLRDHDGPSNAIPPIAALRYAECLFTPQDDNHRMAPVLAMQNHPDAARFDLAVTGVGGDELGMERTYTRRPFEVAGLTSSSAMLASVGRGDMFLRRGILPRNPLATLRVVNFCRRLPQAMRTGRLLHLLTMVRSGLSDAFVFPRYGENFGPVMIREAAMTDFDAEVGESILADYGINIFDTLIGARIEAGYDFTTGQAVKLWYLLKLERILKKYVAGERVGLPTPVAKEAASMAVDRTGRMS